MIFACTSATSYCIKSSHTHQQLVQATTTLAVVWTSKLATTRVRDWQENFLHCNGIRLSSLIAESIIAGNETQSFDDKRMYNKNHWEILMI